jgi:hypothetical protein
MPKADVGSNRDRITGIHYETGDLIHLYIRDGKIEQIESRPLRPEDQRHGSGLGAV